MKRKYLRNGSLRKQRQTLLTRSSLFKWTFSSHSSQLPLAILKPYHLWQQSIYCRLFRRPPPKSRLSVKFRVLCHFVIEQKSISRTQGVCREQIKPVLSGTALCGRSAFGERFSKYRNSHMIYIQRSSLLSKRDRSSSTESQRPACIILHLYILNDHF